MSWEVFSEFMMSDVGRISALVCALILALVMFMFFKRDTQIPLKALTYSAICLALAVVVSTIRVYQMPMGGIVTAGSMFFVSLVGYWFGLKAGLTASISFGFLVLMLDPYVIHPLQFILDYPLAHGFLGLSGLFRGKKYGLIWGYVLGVTGRLLCAILSGVVFFGMFAPEGMNVLLFSFLYNISYIGMEAAVTLVILSIPAFRNAVDTIGRSIISRGTITG